MIGQTLAHFEILEELGEGGMGVVYKARDAKLNRLVAIKVLPAEKLSDPERKRRFMQEARAASALNHPNIVTVHGIEDDAGIDFMVMEFVEGQTLQQLISSGGLRLEEVLDYAAQAADALAAAHAANIIHRDLKPGNIMVAGQGRVKVLDFGLAKLTEAAGDAPGESGVTRTMLESGGPQTEEGTILGTVSYMSPEQAEARKLDSRSDIFSFGAILYEAITGRQAFSEESAISTLAAILHTEPKPVSEIIEATPREVERIINRCLRKNPNRRFQSMADLSVSLEELKEEAESGTLAAPVEVATSEPGAVGGLRRGAGWLAAVLVLVAVIAGILFSWWTSAKQLPGQAHPVTFQISSPDGTSFFSIPDAHDLALSPDGRYLAFIATSNGVGNIWVRPLGSISAYRLEGTEAALSPFWSPDSRSIGFVAADRLRRVEATGGPVQTICTLRSSSISASWGPDGTILFADPGGDGTISRVPASGGLPTPASTLDLDDRRAWDRWPHFLPDGRHFLYVTNRPQGKAVVVGSLDSDESQHLFFANSRVEYDPAGYLLYASDAALLALPFDAKALRVTGKPITVVDRIRYYLPSGSGSFSVARNGILAWQDGAPASRLVWRDRSGRETGSVGEQLHYASLRLSPDRQKVAVEVEDPRQGFIHVWIYDLARNVGARLSTEDFEIDNSAVWSPDGSRVAFSAQRAYSSFQLWMTPVGGGEAEQLIPASPEVELQWASDWSADGRFIAYFDDELKVQILPLFGDRKPIPLRKRSFREWLPAFSPDGRWIAYVSFESGRPEVYVERFSGVVASDDTRARQRISTAGGSHPVWRPDGKELFYVAADHRLMAVPVSTGTDLQPGIPTPLFQLRTAAVTGGWAMGPYFSRLYDVAADGQQFLVNTVETSYLEPPISVSVNWTTGLVPQPR